MRRALTTTILFGMFLVAGARGAESDVRIQIHRPHGFAPLTIDVLMIIEPHKDNRVGRLVWDGTIFSLKEWDHIGEGAWRARTFRIKDLPAGEYEIYLEVVRADGRILRSTVIPVRSLESVPR